MKQRKANPKRSGRGLVLGVQVVVNKDIERLPSNVTGRLRHESYAIAGECGTIAGMFGGYVYRHGTYAQVCMCAGALKTFRLGSLTRIK